MSTDSFRISSVIPAAPRDVYRAWLDSAGHTRMTGSKATVEPHVGGRHTAWDGYIFGEHVELVPERRIVQTWTTTEFPPDSPPSRVEIHLEPEGSGTRITVVHTEIPPGMGGSYETGWQQFYFEPMRQYFSQLAEEVPEPDPPTVQVPLTEAYAAAGSAPGAFGAALARGAADEDDDGLDDDHHDGASAAAGDDGDDGDDDDDDVDGVDDDAGVEETQAAQVVNIGVAEDDDGDEDGDDEGADDDDDDPEPAAQLTREATKRAPKRTATKNATKKASKKATKKATKKAAKKATKKAAKKTTKTRAAKKGAAKKATKKGAKRGVAKKAAKKKTAKKAGKARR